MLAAMLVREHDQAVNPERFAIAALDRVDLD